MDHFIFVEPVIETERLELNHLSAEAIIELFEDKSDKKALANRSITNPHRVLVDDSGPLGWRVPQVKVDPSVNKWFVRWIVLKATGEVIGSTSFHGAPDAEGMIEIGLGIEEPFQNKGYAKESLKGMWLWVSQFPEVKTLRYTVSPDNLPSIAVISYFGFEYMGQQMDDIDGPENIYEMSTTEFQQKWGAAMSDEFDSIIGDIDDELDLTLYADSAELAEEVTVQILAAIEKGLKLKSQFHLVLTGGTLGVQISEAIVNELNAEPNAFDGLHIWWSDERFVPADSVERNAFPFHNTVKNSKVVIHEALASDVARDIEEAVADYDLALENVDIDLNILGLGPDGHVASLFPGIADVDDHRKIFAITDSPKPPAARVSFTMSLINSADEVWIVAAGESKADAVTKIIEGDLSIPASYVRGNSHTRLIVDTEAFFSE